MIVFDLACKNAGHVFEIWFGSSTDYEDQKARGLVSCPYCGSCDVDKAVMAPNVAPKGNGRRDAPSTAIAAAANVPTPEEFKASVARLAEMQGKMLEGSDYVGEKFAEEARAMHLGEQDSRQIHGRTSIEEAKALIEEGIPVAPLLLPVRPPKSQN
ncbi:DUF1178 family protein [Sphingomonas sp. SRS2]|uniref:DUF1178 family protein n=1 Tax=Sphingomonas sp. SRS2 TaxID=133190 RepID=UPI0006184E76|nr:DUF1178 family protein [Sphingomonas sp. SRS2]KKC24345.1 hypothetical protein WP12_19805 [Sphingomonas sp. SRS2]